MAIPVDVHIEAQCAVSNRASCFICGETVKKGTPVIKILGFRINKTLHFDCLHTLESIFKKASSISASAIRCSGKGSIKVGAYEKIKGKYRWKTMLTVDVKEGK